MADTPTSFNQPVMRQSHLTQALPADTELQNHPRRVYDALFSWTPCKLPSAPQMVSWSAPLAKGLGWSADFLNSHMALDWLSGKTPPPGCKTFASCYGGHQFGHWAEQLGDGRAIYLGDTPCQASSMSLFGVHTALQSATLQLKGAGPTPYARQADGLAVLRSSLREYVCSEAMLHLGCPTSRALSLVLSGDQVLRDPLYDGRPALEPGAIVCRVAPSFFRFGHLELQAMRQNIPLLKQLIAYVVETETGCKLTDSDPHQYTDSLCQWFMQVGERTVDMVMHWMRTGFVHGVMNTDNFSTIGITIDYGPFGFLSHFDPHWTPNTTDLPGRRYSYGNQVNITLWNLARLAEALRPLTSSVTPLQDCLAELHRYAQQAWRHMWRQKIGLPAETPKRALDDCIALMFEMLQSTTTDMTLFFRNLSAVDITTTQDTPAATTEGAIDYLNKLPWACAFVNKQTDKFKKEALATSEVTHHFLASYTSLVQQHSDSENRTTMMHRHNPIMIPRHHLLERAINDLTQNGNAALLEQLIAACSRPYESQPEFSRFYESPSPAECQAQLSCSS